MAPSLLSTSFPAFSYYDPIYTKKCHDIMINSSSHFLDDHENDKETNCLTATAHRTRTKSISSRASRLTRRISGGSSSTSSSSSSISSKTGGLTKGARKFVGNLFRSRPSENEWKRVEEETAAAAAAAAAQAQSPIVVTPFLSRMVDGYTCSDTNMPSPSPASWRRRTSTSRFYEHTDDYFHDDIVDNMIVDDHDEALVPLFRCPGEMRLSTPETWAWW